MQNEYLVFEISASIIYEKFCAYHIFLDIKFFRNRRIVRTMLERFIIKRENYSEIFSKKIYNVECL